jgi:hypothetical protein
MGIAYQHDILAWANEQAAFLRAGRFDLLDIDHLAEEIEDVGKSEQRELMSRMAVLLMHLLKWRYQPSRRSSSWRRTIREQRRAIHFHLNDVPSLRARLNQSDWLERCWADTVAMASSETKLADFPESLPWSMGDILSVDWLPPD